MANYVLEFDERATADLEALSPDVAVRIVRRLRELEENPYRRGDTIQRLEGFSIPPYTFRVGDDHAGHPICEDSAPGASVPLWPVTSMAASCRLCAELAGKLKDRAYVYGQRARR